MSSLQISLLHSPLGSSVTRCADPPLLSVRQRTGSVSQSRSGTDRLSVGPKKRQPRVMSLLSLRIFSLVRLFSLLLQLGVIGAEGSTVSGARGSSVLLDPGVKVNPKKNEILWTFISSHKTPLTILHHIPSFPKWAEPSKQFNFRLQFIQSNGSLMVNRLQAGDQGDYSFTMDGRQLNVISLLIFDELPKPSIWINGSSWHSTIQLSCNVDGDSPSYQWRKDGREVSQDQLLDGNKILVIRSASRRDCGTYTCVVTNPVSTVQANYLLTIHDLCLVENVSESIAHLSIHGIVFSAVSFIGFLLLCCLRNELEKGSLRQPKHLFLLLCTCDTLSLVVIFMALISWIAIKGAASASVIALYIVVVLLPLNVCLTITIRNLGCQRIRKFLVRTDLRALIYFCGIMRLIPALIFSIVVLAEKIQQSNRVCHRLPLTWSTVAPLVMVVVMISVSSKVWFKSGGGSCSESKYQEAPKIEVVKELDCSS
ncbi:natural killer cell receptor 2B4-like [Mobula hypostoma]|uniref:natural killer cell receptor 2B4-like n=1 Tax=Mobula hypostoma TaxID=723540 RepID=UPI002FC34F98